MMSRTTTDVFVYGTLKRGQIRAHVLRRQQFRGKATTGPGYCLYDCGDYPALVIEFDAVGGIRGEVWGVDDACLAELDRIEGVHAGLYERQSIVLDAPFAGDDAVTYIYRRDVSGLADCGRVWPPCVEDARSVG